MCGRFESAPVIASSDRNCIDAVHDAFVVRCGPVRVGVSKICRYYNAVVRDLNTRIQSFPDVFLARAFGFSEREYFELADPSEAAVPEVKF